MIPITVVSAHLVLPRFVLYPKFSSSALGFQGQILVPQVVIGHHRVALVALHTEYCHILNSFHSKCHRVVGGQLARLVGTFRIDAELIFPVRAIKAAGAAVLRRDRLAAVVVVETGLALHELFKGSVAAGSEEYIGRHLLSAFGQKKPQTFSKSAAWPGNRTGRCHT